MILSVVQCDTDNGACQYDVRLTDLEAPKDQQADTSYEGGWRIDDRLTREHDRRAGDGTRGSRSRPLYEAFELQVVPVAYEPTAWNHHAEIDGRKDRQRGHDGPSQPSHQVADESGRNDDGTGCDQPDGHRVEELTLV